LSSEIHSAPSRPSSIQPEVVHELALSADAGTVRSSVGRKDVYAVLVLVAASIVGARILTAPGSFSANDRSRWATVRALVETGTYAIGSREENADGTYRDVGIVSQSGWGTVDKVLHPVTRQFYSSKPTLLPTLLAGEYWVLRQALDWHFRRDRPAITRTILITINLLPFVFYLILFARLIERLGTTDWGRLFVFTTACFGTFVSGYLGSLNNHTVAATGGLFAVYHCLRIHLDDDRRWWRFLLAGLFAGWTLCNELPAAALAAGLMVWLMWLSPRDTLRYAMPAMVLPVAAYLFTQYLALGSVLPTYGHERWYRFAGSYWLNPGGVDRADEHKLVYAFHLLVGHSGILSLTPALLLGWIGAVRTLGGQTAGTDDTARRVLAWLTLALTVITFLFYVIRTHNYGGFAMGARWFFWLVPLWLLTMLPEADRWALDRWRRRLAGVLLAVSIATASHALANPWQHSWLYTRFREWGIISYP
jgi:hypothetical protein